jgi:hypothetical protein
MLVISHVVLNKKYNKRDKNIPGCLFGSLFYWYETPKIVKIFDKLSPYPSTVGLGFMILASEPCLVAQMANYRI